MAAALPSLVRTLADRVRPVATHTCAALTAPLSCAAPQARLISRSTAHIRQAFLPVSTKSRSALRQRSAAQHLTCMASSQPFTLVGSGRVGKALADLGAGDDVIIKRGEKVDGPEGPIVVATRNNDLQGVVDATPPERREDLVFIQNGMLQPWLDEKGLGDNTQVLVYFAVAKLGDAPIDGKTDTNPEGLTAAVGKHAEAFAARLSTAGLSCKVLDRVEFKKSMLEKLIWICAIMVVGARHGNISVGEVESQHTQEVSDLIGELAAGGSAELNVKLDDGVVPRLLAYSRSVAGFPTAVKEFEWRNGWFYEQSKQAMEAGTFDPYPRHTEALKEVGAI